MKIHKAIEFAAIAHKTQLRKSTKIPYIVHLFEVSIILAQNNASEDVICAGILHDTLEDTKTTKEDLVENFGDYVTSLVMANSENKSLSWEERKEETLRYLSEEATKDEMYVACADKLSNIRSLQYDYDKWGDELWTHFKRAYDKQKWYYTGLITALERISETKMYEQFKETVNKVFFK